MYLFINLSNCLSIYLGEQDFEKVESEQGYNFRV